jgi:predicted nucleic acid-binding protein
MALRSICLDTDVLIDHLRGDEETIRRIKKLEDEGKILSTTTVNSFELYYGAEKTGKREKNVEAVRRLLDKLVVLEFDGRSAEKAGELAARLESEGNSIGFRDIFIGSTVITNDVELLSKNVRHFEKIHELKLRTM